jgi:hypothetical protein
MLAFFASTAFSVMLAVQEEVVEGKPEDMHNMLSGVRIIGILALIFMVALLVWVIKKL